MTHRYFRSHSDEAYEQARLALDAMWSLPNGVTAIQPAALAPRDPEGRIVLAVDVAACEYPGVPELLSQLIASGAAAEIDAADYEAAIPRTA